MYSDIEYSFEEDNDFAEDRSDQDDSEESIDQNYGEDYHSEEENLPKTYDEPEEDLNEDFGKHEEEELGSGLIGKSGRYLDSRDRYMSLLKTNLDEYGIDKDEKQAIISKIRKIHDFEKLNIKLLVLAGIYNISNRSNIINKDSIDVFIRTYSKKADPLDIIRYITYYNSLNKKTKK